MRTILTIFLISISYNNLFAITDASNDKARLSFASQNLVYLPSVKFKSLIEPAKTLIFIHAPKTGGTNLAYVAEALNNSRETFQAIRFGVPRIKNQSPGII